MSLQVNANGIKIYNQKFQKKLAFQKTHSEERLDNELKEVGISPEKLFRDRSLHGKIWWPLVNYVWVKEQWKNMCT